ncbi:MAG: hypothetical protein O9284_01010 [Steroidobacteraceae bacterium]|nr:hypothetical protein [Steroidobacteraceae bacterium]
MASIAAALLAGCAAAPDGPGPATGGPGPAAGATASADGCSVDLLVQFSPRVGAPGNQAFVAGLLRGTGYHLRYVRTLGTSQLLRLTGPDTTCDAGIAALRRHELVKSVDLDERQFRHLGQ